MLKVAIADDQTLLRDMLEIMLLQDQDIEVVGCAADGHEIIEVCASKKPDVVLLDIKMPGTDGMNALSVIKIRYPEIKVMMLTTFEEESNILEAYKHGADGYVLKDIKPSALILAVKCIHEGLFVIHKSVNQYIQKQLKYNSSAEHPVIIESNEAEKVIFDKMDLSIIKMLADGRNNKEIAEGMNFSEGTIKNRISRMLAVTGFKDRTQIAIFALKNNII